MNTTKTSKFSACHDDAHRTPPTSPTMLLGEDFVNLHCSEESPIDKNSTALGTLALACLAAEKEKHAVVEEQATIICPGLAESNTVVDSLSVGNNDVLCGRGGLTNHHPGNVFYRRLVRIKQESYLIASKHEKARIAREIVELISGLTPKGRFLKKKERNAWIEISSRKAREKTSQALREGAPELREDLKKQEVGRQQTPNKKQPRLSSEERHSKEHTCQTKQPYLPSLELPQSQFIHPVVDDMSNSNSRISFHSTRYMKTIDFTSIEPAPTCNRARVVSLDSLASHDGGTFLLPTCSSSDDIEQQNERPHFIVDTSVTCSAATTKGIGTKRKVDEVTTYSLHEPQQCSTNTSNPSKGPRLKVLKSRVECCM